MRCGQVPGKKYGGYVLPVATNGKQEYLTGQSKKVDVQPAVVKTTKNDHKYDKLSDHII